MQRGYPFIHKTKRYKPEKLSGMPKTRRQYKPLTPRTDFPTLLLPNPPTPLNYPSHQFPLSPTRSRLPKYPILSGVAQRETAGTRHSLLTREDPPALPAYGGPNPAAVRRARHRRRAGPESLAEPPPARRLGRRRVRRHDRTGAWTGRRQDGPASPCPSRCAGPRAAPCPCGRACLRSMP